MPDDGKIDNTPTDAFTVDTGARATPEMRETAVPEIGGFRILRKLGEGGMGIVYEAEQQNPSRRVALKVIRGGLFVDEVRLRMFHRESETLARLAHPNIASIYAAGATGDGQHFFTMELVEGQTLNTFVAERLGGGKPTAEQIRERLRLFATICRAVNYAHQRGVIHRDLKPSNVVITETGQVKVLDFGLARITDSDIAPVTLMSELGTIRGTLPYMSPEQTRGDSRDLDLRSDVYGLGVILYELLTGRLPYDLSGQSVVSAIRTICEESPPALAEIVKGLAIDTDLGTISEKALAKEPDDRYQSAGALADDIDRYLADQPILAHPPSTMYMLRKLVSRHKGRVAALGVIGGLILTLMITTMVQGRRVREERDRATAEAAKSEAINRFLFDALGTADPWQRGSRTVTLMDALAQAQAKASSAFKDQPLVEASVLRTLGTIFANLAEYEQADAALRASLALREGTVGRRSMEGADTLDGLAALQIQWQRYDDAEKYAREALDISRQVYGATDLHTAVSVTNLATALARMTKGAEAKSLAEEALRIVRAPRAGGQQADAAIDPVQIENYALSVLGELTMRDGDYKEMERIDLERLALLRAKSGPGSDLGQILNDLGTAQMMKGDLETAQRTYDEAIQILSASLGADHPLVAVARENMGNVYFQQGKLDQTARNLEVVLAMRRKALGDDSEPVARTLANMATVYRRAGRNAEAITTYREAVDRLTRKLGPQHPDVGITMAGLGDTLRREGKFAEAETSLRHGLDILVASSGEDNPLTQRALQWLADLYTDWKKPDLAAAYKARVKPAK